MWWLFPIVYFSIGFLVYLETYRGHEEERGNIWDQLICMVLWPVLVAKLISLTVWIVYKILIKKEDVDAVDHEIKQKLDMDEEEEGR